MIGRSSGATRREFWGLLPARKSPRAALTPGTVGGCCPHHNVPKAFRQGHGSHRSPVSPSAGHAPPASPAQGPAGHGCLGVAGCSGSPMALISMASSDGGKCQQAQLHNQGSHHHHSPQHPCPEKPPLHPSVLQGPRLPKASWEHP